MESEMIMMTIKTAVTIMMKTAMMATMKTSGMPSPYSPSSILILVNRGEELSMLLFGSTWMRMTLS